MTVINAVGSLPGLGRLIVNHVISSGNSTDKSEIAERLLPGNLRTGENSVAKIDSTLTAIRDSGLLSLSGNTVSTTHNVNEFSRGEQLTPEGFRRLLQKSIFEANYEDPWDSAETLTSGAKDLNRALSWFLAQDCRSTLTWDMNSAEVHSAQTLQAQQLYKADSLPLQPFSNDVRWNTFARWSVAIGLAEPALLGSGLHPNATVAIRDITLDMASTVLRVDDYLDQLAKRLPVLSGGTMRQGLLNHTDSDPDPHASIDALDTTVGQALLALEEEGLLVLKSESDTDRKTINFGATPRSITHIDVRGATK